MICEYNFFLYLCRTNWGISSVGRAFEWHSKGQEFDSPMLHKNPSQISLRGIFRIGCDKKCNNLVTEKQSTVVYSQAESRVIISINYSITALALAVRD